MTTREQLEIMKQLDERNRQHEQEWREKQNMNQIERNSTPREPFRSPAKAIRAFCLDCVNNSPTEVKLCPAVGCPLYAWRFGTTPECFRREYSEEERAAARERFYHNVLDGENRAKTVANDTEV